MTTFAPILDRVMTLSRALDEVAGVPEGTTGSGWTGTSRGLWYPAVDTYETSKAFVIECDLPGVSADQVELNFERNTLTISGTRGMPFSQDSDTGSGESTVRDDLRVYSAERLWGPFTRSIRLPEHVDGDHIAAKFHQGVLTVTVPKAPSAVPRRIQISASAHDKQ